MHGSPIRPPGALSILGIECAMNNLNMNMKNQMKMKMKRKRKRRRRRQQQQEQDQNEKENSNSNSKSSTGWNTHTIHSYDDSICDIDIIEDGDLSSELFFRDYFVTGRPLVLRNHTSATELLSFHKSYFMGKKNSSDAAVVDEDGYSPHWHTETFRVGPTAYPSHTGQQYCNKEYTIEELEAGLVCDEMPDAPMVYAYHPKGDDFHVIWPDYNGDPMSSIPNNNNNSNSNSNSNDNNGSSNNINNNNDTINNASFRIIKQWFGHVVNGKEDVSWQVFFGGDGSGATFHWHQAAFNMLYVGVKEWKIAPPLYRGLSGMPALLASKALDLNIVTDTSNYSSSSSSNVPTHIQTLRCIQKPGDLFFIPNYWGHMTINHGFTIGAAAIMGDYFQTDGSESLRSHGNDDDDTTSRPGPSS